MTKIIGNTTATPNPQPDWNQSNDSKADYIKNKPNIEELVSNQMGGLKFLINENGILTISIEEEQKYVYD